MYNSPGISIALIFITVGIGFKLSPAPSHQWTPAKSDRIKFVHTICSRTSRSITHGKEADSKKSVTMLMRVNMLRSRSTVTVEGSAPEPR
ncbi:hypothetical protein QVD17_08872 [Tagetes erecta]|uniref:NADH:quinone oxidoreductase/Mrp antiporter membrane subunit domain-containing protein n=1 Tax=Tagetes erecta TaxID=13708 RepID=A0AAD8L2U7_TARER|nr:hypothetical protein QVD17_08872 [Tagetes erecta]